MAHNDCYPASSPSSRPLHAAARRDRLPGHLRIQSGRATLQPAQQDELIEHMALLKGENGLQNVLHFRLLAAPQKDPAIWSIEPILN
jgi:hypothetical protein